MTQSASHPSIEPWQLTAYALNELEPSDAARVEHALETDVAIRVEFEQIQQTLTAVRTAFASTAANVGLSDSQTAVVSSQFEQMAAPNAITAVMLPPVATIKLAGRPFYRRKRFAALLATAAAIPLAATWMPSLFENGGPFAVYVNDSTLPSSILRDNVQFSREADSSVATMSDSSASTVASSLSNESKDFIESATELPALAEAVLPYNPVPEGRAKIVASEDAVASESGLQGDADVSFLPEMGLVIVKGNKQEVEKAKQAIAGIGGKNEIASPSAIEAAKRRLHYSDSFTNKTSDENVVTPDGGTSLLDGIKRLRSPEPSDGEAHDDSKTDTLMMSVTPRAVVSEEEGVALGVKEAMPSNLEFSDNSGEAKVDGPVSTGKQDGPDSFAWPEALQKSRDLALQAMKSEISKTKSEDTGPSAARGRGIQPKPITDGRDIFGATGLGTGYSGHSSKGMPTSDSKVVLDETLASHDKRTRDTDSLPLQQLPDELRANAPHLFKREAKESSGTDRFEKIVETPFLETQKAPLSTFSIDVDTASYSKIRQTIMEGNRLPSPNMVRIEEMVNYFEYGYDGPQDESPFAAHMSVDQCPWNTEHQLVRVGLQAKKLGKDKRVKANIVFLLDVSGSMNEPNKLPLVKKALSMMVNQLNENDRVAIVVYAGAAGCVLPSTCGAEKQAILSSLEHLNAGGSTNGGQGIQLAYSIAKEHFIPGGANRVVLCTDGDFNVGVTGDDALVAMMQENAKSNIFLTCLGFGAGNYNDTLMEKISNKGNGIYGMIDNELEARRMMVEQLGGTLVTVAKDVKIQVDFNPAKVAGYRLIGYEDRRLANKDFDNDQKDAGEIGAGHRVTALYEVIPAGKWVGIVPPSESETSKYSKNPKFESSSEKSPNGEFPAELLTLKVRYKEPEGSVSTEQEFVLKDSDRGDQPAVDRDMQWATSVAEFGLLLRRSEMAPHADWTEMLERAGSSAGGDAYRLECLAMMRKARSMFR